MIDIQAYYFNRTSEFCPNNCLYNGTCQGYCLCSDGYFDDDCGLQAEELNIKVSAKRELSLTPFIWKNYFFKIENMNSGYRTIWKTKIRKNPSAFDVDLSYWTSDPFLYDMSFTNIGRVETIPRNDLWEITVSVDKDEEKVLFISFKNRNHEPCNIDLEIEYYDWVENLIKQGSFYTFAAIALFIISFIVLKLYKRYLLKNGFSRLPNNETDNSRVRLEM